MKRSPGSLLVAALAGLVLPLVSLGAGVLLPTPARAGSADKRLDLQWVDVEGGAATLLVTPAGESILIDTGNPGERDAGRIQRALGEAGLKRIDHVVITHYHTDHYGGLADIVKSVPVRNLYQRDPMSAPEKERTAPPFGAYAAAQVGKRVTIKPGAELPLKQAPGAARLRFQFLGASEKFVAGKGAAGNAELCKDSHPSDPDASDNRNSVVMLVSFGPFRFFDGGDLTWNTEAALVCPKNQVGTRVDVFQVDHHGLDLSNNPVLVKSLAPTVAVVNNGAGKGGEPRSFRTLKSTPSIQAIYQLHRNVRANSNLNTEAVQIANLAEGCEGSPVRLSVDPTGKSYVVKVPSTQHERTFSTQKK